MKVLINIAINTNNPEEMNMLQSKLETIQNMFKMPNAPLFVVPNNSEAEKLFHRHGYFTSSLERWSESYK